MFNDLREFIQKSKELDEYKLLEGADCDLEIGVLSELEAAASQPSLLLFDNIKGYKTGYRVVSNLFASPRRTALGLGLPLEARGVELVRAYRDKIKAGVKPLPPQMIENGPVKENIHIGKEVNLYEFPSPKWHELDGGRYIGTGAVTIQRDPDTGWVNLGVYRVQVYDESTAAINITLGHHGDIIQRKYWAKGLPCPAAVSCGQEPVLFATGSDSWPWGVSEYDAAGSLKGEPISVTKGVTTDLPIPATAEIVLEGEIVPPDIESRKEGPFGEWTGYYAAPAREKSVFRVKSVLHRNNPIIQGAPPSILTSAWSLGRHIQVAASLWDELDKQIPGVKGVSTMENTPGHLITVISLQQMYGGHAKQAGLLAAGLSTTGFSGKFYIVVDEDINPSNTAEVLWALATRTEPEDGIEIVRGCWGSQANPLITPERRKQNDLEHSVAIVLACRPFNRIKDFAPTIRTSPELLQRIRKKWAQALGS